MCLVFFGNSSGHCYPFPSRPSTSVRKMTRNSIQLLQITCIKWHIGVARTPLIRDREVTVLGQMISCSLMIANSVIVMDDHRTTRRNETKTFSFKTL